MQNIDKLKAKGVADVICMAVNDAFVMGAWARDQKTGGKVRMMGDGSASYTKALGLEFDLTARGLGVRCQRFSMLVDNGVVKALNVEAPGKYEVSDAETMLTDGVASRAWEPGRRERKEAEDARGRQRPPHDPANAARRPRRGYSGRRGSELAR